MSKRLIIVILAILIVGFCTVWATITNMEALAVTGVTGLIGIIGYYVNQETKRPSGTNPKDDEYKS